MQLDVRIIEREHRAAALTLAWDVFLQRVAPDYTKEGVETFKKYVEYSSKMDALVMYGAYDGDTLAGMIAAGNNGGHIALFFVQDTYCGKGVGRALFNEMLENSPGATVTVNSSPYALEVYKKLGFTPDGPARADGGIVCIPMTLQK